jgi:uncharacterized Zn ribbon protein
MNPLAKHFRQPAIFLNLPSRGNYWPDGSLDLPLSGQIPIYPMTTRDEITIRTPDALLNGQSVVTIIESCCPNIKDAWKMPTIDTDALLIGIRIASYGQNMDVDTICPNPECKNENTHSLDLSSVLDSIGNPNYDSCLLINDLKIKLKPQNYQEGSKVNMSSFEEQRILAVVQDDTIENEEKIKVFNDHLQKMVTINLEILSNSTEYIELDDGTVVREPLFIKEFYDNADNRVIKAIRDNLESIAKMSALPKPKIKCEECGTEYPVEVQFDYSNFFAVAS